MEVKTSIIQNGRVIVLQGSESELSFNPAELPDAVKAALVNVAVQRVFRERTAGKVDSEDDRVKAVANIRAQWDAWKNGDLQIERAGKVELTPDEIAAAKLDFIVSQKRARGDQRPEAQIKKAFNELDPAKQVAVFEALKKPLNKFLKERLAAKRKGDKMDW